MRMLTECASGTVSPRRGRGHAGQTAHINLIGTSRLTSSEVVAAAICALAPDQGRSLNVI